jgi:hypothetical protein
MPKKTVQPKLTPEEYKRGFEQNAATFCSMHPQLLKHYKGQWVAIYDARLVDVDVNHSELITRMMRKYGYDTPWYIQHVVEEVIPIELVPGMNID